jgi:hypothetical protein
MRRNSLVLSVAALVLASLACALPKLPIGDGALFKDDFSSEGGGWGTGDTDNSSVKIKGGELVINVHRDRFLVWSPAGQKDLENVHIEATAKNVGGGSSTGFGLICNISVTDQFYYFLVTSNGEYAIAKTAVAKDDVYLTNNDRLANSSDIPVDAPSYRIGADCGNGALTLYVNGKKIDSVEDSAYSKGDIGLMAMTSKDSTAEVHFDDVIVTSLSAAK